MNRANSRKALNALDKAYLLECYRAVELKFSANLFPDLAQRFLVVAARVCQDSVTALDFNIDSLDRSDMKAGALVLEQMHKFE